MGIDLGHDASGAADETASEEHTEISKDLHQGIGTRWIIVTRLSGLDTYRGSMIQCRIMEKADLDAVISIHKSAFVDFFLTRMGPYFLRAYYQSVLDFNDSIVLVAYEESSSLLLGFAVGFRNPQKFYTLFSRRKRQLLPVILLAILRDPTLIPDILRNIHRVEAQAQQPSDAVELSSIAVRAEAAGQGVGSTLLDVFVMHARSRGAAHLFLTTDEKDNDSVRRFYEARGFTLDGLEARGERRLCHYVRVLG